MSSRAKRIDANQPEIVKALKAAGCSVLDLHEVGKGCPDLLVGWQGQDLLVEIKTEDGKLEPVQVDFHRDWRGRCIVARSAAEVFAALGLEVRPQK